MSQKQKNIFAKKTKQTKNNNYYNNQHNLPSSLQCVNAKKQLLDKSYNRIETRTSYTEANYNRVQWNLHCINKSNQNNYSDVQLMYGKLVKI